MQDPTWGGGGRREVWGEGKVVVCVRLASFSPLSDKPRCLYDRGWTCEECGREFTMGQ